MPPAPVRVTSRCAEARLRISARTSFLPTSSEVGSGRFVGGNSPGIGVRFDYCRAGSGLRAAVFGVDLGRELVAASGHGTDQITIRTKSGAQRRNLPLEIIF